MFDWSNPTFVEIFGKRYDIRNRCDYRVVLDASRALEDEEEEDDFRIYCALHIFYQNPEKLPNVFNLSNEKEAEIIGEAVEKMMFIMNLGENVKKDENQKPKLLDWNHDFKNISGPLSQVLGYSVRDENNYTHWYDFAAGFGEIKECYWSEIMKIRLKRMKGKPLDKSEQDFYREHKDDINMPIKLSKEDQEWFDDDW